MRPKSGLDMHFWTLPLLIFLVACSISNGQDSAAGPQTPEERYKLIKWGPVNTQTATGQILITNPRGTVLWSQQSEDGSVLRVVKRNLRRTSYDGHTNHIIDRNFALISRPDSNSLEFEIPITTTQQLVSRASLDPDGTFVTVVQRKIDQLPNGYEKPLDLHVKTATSLVKTIQERIQPNQVITINETYTKEPINPFSPRDGAVVKEVDQVFAPSTEQSAGDDAQLVGPYHTILQDTVDADGNKVMIVRVPIQRTPDGVEVDVNDVSLASHIKTVLRTIRPDGKVKTQIVRIPTLLPNIPVQSKKRQDDTPVPPETIKHGISTIKIDYPIAVGSEGKTPHRIFSDVVLSNGTRVITTRYKFQMNPDMSTSVADFDNHDPKLGVKTITTWIRPTGEASWFIEPLKLQGQKPEETKSNARIIQDGNLPDGTRKLIYRIKEARDLENKTIDIDYSDDNPETIVKEVTKLYKPSGSIKTHIVNSVQGIVFPEEAKKQVRVYGRSDDKNGTRKVFYKVKIFKHPDDIETPIDYEDSDPNAYLKFVNKTYLPSGHVHSLIRRQRKRVNKVGGLETTTPTTPGTTTAPPNNILSSYITPDGTNVVIFTEYFRKLPEGQEEILGDDDKSPDLLVRILVKKIYANGTVEITPQEGPPPEPVPSAQVLPEIEPEIENVPTFAPAVEIPGETTPDVPVQVEPETVTEDQDLPMLPTEDATELPTERPFEPTDVPLEPPVGSPPGVGVERPGGFEEPMYVLPESMWPSGKPDDVQPGEPVDIDAFTFEPPVKAGESTTTQATSPESSTQRLMPSTNKIESLWTTQVPEVATERAPTSIVAETKSQVDPIISIPKPVPPTAITAAMVANFLRPGKPRLAPDTFELAPSTCACSPGRVQLMPSEINPRREIIETITEPDGTSVILYKVKMLIEPDGSVFELPKDDLDPAAVILRVMRHIHPDGSVESKIIDLKPNNVESSQQKVPGFKVPPPPPPVPTIYTNESIPVSRGKTEVMIQTKNSRLPTVPGQPGFLSNSSIIIIDKTQPDGKRTVVHITEVITLPNGNQVYVRPDNLENGKKIFVLTEFLPDGRIFQKNITSEAKEHKVNVVALPVVPSGASITSEGNVLKPAGVKNAVPTVPALEQFKTYEDLVIITHYEQQDGCIALLVSTRVKQNGDGTLKTLPIDDYEPSTYVITLLQRQCLDGSIITYRVIGPSKEDAELNVDTIDFTVRIPVRPGEKIYLPEQILVPPTPGGNLVPSTAEKWIKAPGLESGTTRQPGQPNGTKKQPELSSTTNPLQTSTRSPSEAKVTKGDTGSTQGPQSSSGTKRPEGQTLKPDGKESGPNPLWPYGTSGKPGSKDEPTLNGGTTPVSGTTRPDAARPGGSIQIENLFPLLPNGHSSTIVNFFVQPDGTKVIFYVVNTIRKSNEPDKILLPTDQSPEATYVTYILIQHPDGKMIIQEVHNPLQPPDPRFPEPWGTANVTIPSTPEETDPPKIPSPKSPTPKPPAPAGTTPDGINLMISNVTDSNGKETVIGTVSDPRPSGTIPGQSIPQVIIVQEKYPDGTLKTFQATDPHDLNAVTITATIPFIDVTQIGTPTQTEEVPQKNPSHPQSPYNPANLIISEYVDQYGYRVILFVVFPSNSENATLPQKNVPFTTIAWQETPEGFVTTRQVTAPDVYSKPSTFVDIPVKIDSTITVKSKPQDKSSTENPAAQFTTQDPVTALQKIITSNAEDNGFVVTSSLRPDGSFVSIVIYKGVVGPNGELNETIPFNSPSNSSTKSTLMLQETYPNGTIVMREIVTPDKQQQVLPSQVQTQQVLLGVYPFENVYWYQNHPGAHKFTVIPEGSKFLSTINQPDESILTIYLVPKDDTDDSDSDPLGRVYVRTTYPDGRIQINMVVTPQTRPLRPEDVLRNLTIWVKPSTTPQTFEAVRPIYKIEPDLYKIYIVRNITEPDGSKTSVYIVKVAVRPDGKAEYVPTNKTDKGTRWVTIVERIDPNGKKTWTETKEEGKSWPVLPEFQPNKGNNCEKVPHTEESISETTTELPSTSRLPIKSTPQLAATTMQPNPELASSTLQPTRPSTEQPQIPGSEKRQTNPPEPTVDTRPTPEPSIGPYKPTGPGGKPYPPTGPGGEPYPPTGPGGEPYSPTGPGGKPYPPTGPGGKPYPPTGPGGEPYPPAGPGGEPYPPPGPGGEPYPPTGPGGEPYPPTGPGGKPYPPTGPGGQPYPPRGPGGQPYPPTGPGGEPYPPTGPGGQPYPPTGPGGQPYPPTGPGGQPYPPTGPGGQPYPPTGPGGEPYPSTGPGGQPFEPTRPGSKPYPPTAPGGKPYPSTGPGGQPYPSTGPGGQPFEPTRPGSKPYKPTGPGGEPYPPTGPGGKPYPPTAPGGQPYPPTGPGGQPFPPTGPGGQPYPPTGPGGEPYPSTGPGGQPFEPTRPGSKPYKPTGPSGEPYEPTAPGGNLYPSTGPGGQPYPPTGPGGQPFEPTRPGSKPYKPTGPGGKPYETTGPDGKPYETTGPEGKPYEPTEPGSEQGRPTGPRGEPTQPSATAGPLSPGEYRPSQPRTEVPWGLTVTSRPEGFGFLPPSPIRPTRKPTRTESPIWLPSPYSETTEPSQWQTLAPPSPLLPEPKTEEVPRPSPIAPPVKPAGPLYPTEETNVPPAPELPITGVPNITDGTELVPDGSVIANIKVRWTWRPDGSVEYLQPDDPRPGYTSWYQEHIYRGSRIDIHPVRPPTGHQWSIDSSEDTTTAPPVLRVTRPTRKPLIISPLPLLPEPESEEVPRSWPIAPSVKPPGPVYPTEETNVPPAPELPLTGVPNITDGTELVPDGSVTANVKVRWTWRPDGSVEYLQPDDPRSGYTSWYQEHIYRGGRIEINPVRPPTGHQWKSEGTKLSKPPQIYPNGTVGIINEKWVYVYNQTVEDYDGDIYNPHLWVQVNETQIHPDGTITLSLRYEPVPNKPRVPPPPATELVIPLQPAEPGRKVLGTTVRSDGSTATYYYARIIRNPDGTTAELSPEDKQPADGLVLRQRIIWLNKTQTVTEIQKPPKEIEFHGFRPKEVRQRTDGTVIVTVQRKIRRSSTGSIRELDWSEDLPNAEIWQKSKFIKPSGYMYVEEAFWNVRKSPAVDVQILKHVYPNGTIIYTKNGQIISSSSPDAQESYIDYSKYQKKSQSPGEDGSFIEIFERRYQKSTDGIEYPVAFNDNSEGTYIDTVAKTTYENGDTTAARKLSRIPIKSLTSQIKNPTQTSVSMNTSIRKIKKFPNGTSIAVDEELGEKQLKPTEIYEAQRPPYPALNPNEPVQDNPTYTLVEQKVNPDGADVDVYEKRVRKYADGSEYNVPASDNTVNTFTKRVTFTQYPNGRVKRTVSYVPVEKERRMEVSIIDGNYIRINNVVRNMPEVLREDSPEGHYLRKLYPQIQEKLRQRKGQ